ncbi:uncharacterized protein AMSG_11987 [Thecamonas trahens ATCC 50062]|uniref:Methionine aminopeptidase n=1 Tax=Thecamonas trahens ATCC 50062 TaxID=461836 RepID=A0A0L0DGE4_THETB|nr:hypothetical protein AMSG_11987 [Thecamonas trahens ATCC 50062]KNC51191.1 hypothetical protein AMSG_11987 [Thecamonas trahens ATCC 50062]|eukprot:XP_013756438.1 hypothetical protein AMSG_11987 [Thecamonas trahens ATCC 50062]
MAAASESTRLTLVELPVDVLGAVAVYLPPDGLVALMGTCGTIRRALMHDALVWRVRFDVADYMAFARGLCAPPGTVVAISSSRGGYASVGLFDLALVVPGASDCDCLSSSDASSIKWARASHAVADAREMIAMLEASGVASASAAHAVVAFHDHVRGATYVTPMPAHLGARMIAAAAAVGIFVPGSIYGIADVDGDDDPLQLGLDTLGVVPGESLVAASRGRYGCSSAGIGSASQTTQFRWRFVLLALMAQAKTGALSDYPQLADAILPPMAMFSSTPSARVQEQLDDLIKASKFVDFVQSGRESDGVTSKPIYEFYGAIPPPPSRSSGWLAAAADGAGDVALPPYALTGGASPPMEPPLVLEPGSDEDVRARRAAALAARILGEALAAVEDGSVATSAEVDALVVDAAVAAGAYPSPLNYSGFPAAVCVSPNEILCHGIPNTAPFLPADVVSIDVSVYLDGFHGDTADAAIVPAPDGTPTPASCADLVAAARGALHAGIAAAGPGVPLAAIGAAIAGYVAAKGLSVSPDFCGHGIGRHFHTLPFVVHDFNYEELILESGMVFTIEPIVAEGDASTFDLWDDGWTAVTPDGSWSAQAEHTILITDSGVDILTARPSTQQAQ